MSYNEKADNIAQLTIECESCSEIITLVSGSGRYSLCESMRFSLLKAK